MMGDFFSNLFGLGGSATPQFNMGNFLQEYGDTPFNQLTPDVMSQFTTGLQGSQQGGMDGIFGSLGPILQGGAAVGGYFNDKNQQAMMKDLMQKQMQMQMSEIGRQKQAYNTQLADRQHGRTNKVNSSGEHVTPAWHLPVDEYMNQHRMA